MRLLEKQKRFVDYFLESANATEAAIKAGYAAKYAGSNADRLLKTARVQSYLEQRLKEIESARIAQPVEIMQYLTSVLRGESDSEIVVVEGVGNGRSKAKNMLKKPDEKERLRAAELLGKRYAMFTDKVNLDTTQQDSNLIELFNKLKR